MVDDDEPKTPPEGTRRNAALAQRSAEARTLANVAGQLATAADQLRSASERIDGLTGSARRQLVARITDALEHAADACGDVSATVGGEATAVTAVNWAALPWKKLVLLALAGAAGAAASGLPADVLFLGFSLQKALIGAAGLLAGWAKRAPGDVKSPPPP